MNRYPYHRYLRWLALEGESAKQIQGHVADLGFVRPRLEDLEEIVRTCTQGQMTNAYGAVESAQWRQHCDVEIFDEAQDSEDLDRCYSIVETAPLRALAERFLIERMALHHIATVLNLRANAKLTEESIRLFRDCFWDTKTLTSIDFRNYYTLGRIEREVPHDFVPIAQQPAAAAWEAGILPDDSELSTDDIVRSIQVASYMKFMKAVNDDTPGQDKFAVTWAKMAMQSSQMQRSKKIEKKQSDLPKMMTRVSYPSQTITTLQQIQEQERSDTVPETYLLPDSES